MGQAITGGWGEEAVRAWRFRARGARGGNRRGAVRGEALRPPGGEEKLRPTHARRHRVDHNEQPGDRVSRGERRARRGMDETGHDGDPAGDAGEAGETSDDPAARRHSHAGTRVHDRESEILPAAADREQAEGSGAAGQRRREGELRGGLEDVAGESDGDRGEAYPCGGAAARPQKRDEEAGQEGAVRRDEADEVDRIRAIHRPDHHLAARVARGAEHRLDVRGCPRQLILEQGGGACRQRSAARPGGNDRRKPEDERNHARAEGAAEHPVRPRSVTRHRRLLRPPSSIDRREASRGRVRRILARSAKFAYVASVSSAEELRAVGDASTYRWYVSQGFDALRTWPLTKSGPRPRGLGCWRSRGSASGRRGMPRRPSRTWSVGRASP